MSDFVDGPGLFPDDATIEIVDQGVETKLDPDSQLHSKTLGRLRLMRDRGREASETRFDDMDRTREHLNLYVDLSRGARNADKSIGSDKEMPWGRAVVVPVTHAIMHAFLVQLMSIFGSRDPIMPVRGRGPEDIVRAQLVDAMMAYDCQRMAAFQSLYTFLQDSLISHGVMYDYWDTEIGVKIDYEPIIEDPTIQSMLDQAFGPDARKKVRSQGLITEGNKWRPIDPYRFLPDPRVPVWDIQNMDFVGHDFDISYTDLIARQGDTGPYFNIDKLQVGQSSKTSSKSEAGIDQGISNPSLGGFDKGFYECTHMQVKIIPKDWGLGSEEFPVKWYFTWADDSIIIRAHPCEYDHQQFTYSVAQSEHDFHSTFAPGMMEQIDGLQRFMNWSLNSHVQNVSRFLNDAFVYHPSWVESEDIFEPGPARHIRLTDEGKEAILDGRVPASSLFFQLPVQDVTGPTHMGNMNMFMTLAEKATGVNGPSQGTPLPTKRTATEISTIMAAASQRVSVIARLIDAMAISPLAARSISNRVQLTSMEQFFRLTGDMSKELQGMDSIWLSRDMIQGQYDYIPNSGIHSPDPVKMAELYFNMIQVYGQNPSLLEPSPSGLVPDIHKMARDGFKNAGAKNIDAYFMQMPPQMTVMPDEEVQQQAQAGNLVQM